MEEVEAALTEAYELFARGDFIPAYYQFKRVEDLGGLNARLANDMGVALYQAGLHHEALGEFKRAIELDGNSMVALNLIDIIEAQESRLREVQTQAEDAFPRKANPDLFAMYERLAHMRIEDARQVWFQNSAGALHRRVQEMDDDQWLQAVVDSAEREPLDGFLMPGFVAEQDQRNFVGSAGRVALVEASHFVRVIIHFAQKFGLKLGGGDFRVCDFGSGWGRYTRFMLKYAHPDNIYGLDVSSPMLEQCRKNFGMCNFLKVSAFPPSPLRDGLFDIAFGYSVFSHLSRSCADAWIEEFARIVRPGGLVLMTTQGRGFIEFCRQIRDSGDRSHGWFECLARSFVDVEDSYVRYDHGEFMHSATTQESSYGETMIPKGYIEKNWTRDFELVEFIDDQAFLPQALFVLRRR